LCFRIHAFYALSIPESMIVLALSLAVLCPLPVSVLTPSVDRLVAAAADSAIENARAALARGQPWRASRLLAPVVADSTRRTPEATLLAATAASRWNGWREVRELLEPAAWLDDDGGAGRALYARALLEADADSTAANESARAVAAARDDRSRAERRVILARALDRLDSLAGAADAYSAAADGLPEIREWLVYRAAIVTADSAARNKLFASLTRPEVREHLAAARADGLLRSGDSVAAASAYAGTGDLARSWRIRLALADSGSPARDTLQRELMDVIRTSPGTARASAAVDLLDQAFAPHSAATELLIAQAIASRGPARRTADAYHRALAAGLGDSRDHWRYAQALASLGRYAEAAAEFGKVRAPTSLAASAAYQRGRAMVREGRASAGRTALRAILRDYPHETEPAATALFLLADLATDEGRDGAARNAFRDIVARYPKASLAPQAAFRAAIIAYVSGSYRTAATEFDALAALRGTNPERDAATYWAGRAWEKAGDSATARTRWRTAQRDTLGYYGARASQRLGLAPWTPAEAPEQFVAVADVDSALGRVALLRMLGMDREADWELATVSGMAGDSVERVLAIASSLREADEASRSMRMVWRAIALGAPRDARTMRLLYPVLHQEALKAEAKHRGVDPVFAAALIRQESNFTPWATSRAGARGLMQLMPSVGHVVARSLGYPIWDPVLLYQPDVNLELGMAHLGELEQRYHTPVEILAAYNAGVSRVERWNGKAGTDDPEIFAERIPFSETRDYVRIIQRNMDFYRALYDW
jgi:soluble lytic murein transglycosylase